MEDGIAQLAEDVVPVVIVGGERAQQVRHIIGWAVRVLVPSPRHRVEPEQGHRFGRRGAGFYHRQRRLLRRRDHRRSIRGQRSRFASMDQPDRVESSTHSLQPPRCTAIGEPTMLARHRGHRAGFSTADLLAAGSVGIGAPVQREDLPPAIQLRLHQRLAVPPAGRVLRKVAVGAHRHQRMTPRGQRSRNQVRGAPVGHRAGERHRVLAHPAPPPTRTPALGVAMAPNPASHRRSSTSC
jgi:hypothetical protein